MNGTLLNNPVYEGLIIVAAGVAMAVIEATLKVPGLADVGKLLMGVGVGYIGGKKLGQ